MISKPGNGGRPLGPPRKHSERGTRAPVIPPYYDADSILIYRWTIRPAEADDTVRGSPTDIRVDRPERAGQSRVSVTAVTFES